MPRKRVQSNSVGDTLRKKCIDDCVRTLLEKKQANGGRLPHQAMEKALKGLHEVGCRQMTRDKMNYYLRSRAKKKVHSNDNTFQQVPLREISVDLQDPSVVSTLGSVVGSAVQSQGGGPQGSTKENTRQQEIGKKQCITAIANLYIKAKQDRLFAELSSLALRYGEEKVDTTWKRVQTKIAEKKKEIPPSAIKDGDCADAFISIFE